MSRLICLVAVLTPVAALVAAPEVTLLSCDQQPDSLNVKVVYALNEDAIVTVDFQTNTQKNATGEWVSIGGRAYRNATGDVHKLVSAGETRTIEWNPLVNWPGRKFKNFRAVVTAWAKGNPPDWLMADLTGTKEVNYYADPLAMPYGNILDVSASEAVANKPYKSTKLVMRRIHAKGKRFLMGNDRYEFEKQVQGSGVTYAKRINERGHQAVLSYDYYMGAYFVTNDQKWYAMGGGTCPDNRLPAKNVSYKDLRGPTDGAAYPVYTDGVFDMEKSLKTDLGSVVERFRNKTGLKTLDIPSEAEYTFAVRGGDRGGYLYSRMYFTGENASKVTRWNGNIRAADCEGKTGELATVGSYPANPYGLFEMMMECGTICRDWYESWENIDVSAVHVNPIGPKTGTNRSYVGGICAEALPWSYLTRRGELPPGSNYPYASIRLMMAIH